MTIFQVDEQTLKDLEIFGARKGNNIAALLDETVSKGGELALGGMLEYPVADISLLEDRQAAVQYLAEYPDFVDMDRNRLTFIEVYLEQEYHRKSFNIWNIWCRELKYKLKPNNEWNVCHRGVAMLSRLLCELEQWTRETITGDAPFVMQKYRNRIEELLFQSDLKLVLVQSRMTLNVFGHLDFIFRRQENGKVRKLLGILYELEALRSVARRAKVLGFTYPEYSNTRNCLEIEGLYHPFLEEPVRNDFHLREDQHLCFLTGPNMAGKSTYMKALGIAVFLAHVGFPVPARQMKVSVFRGLFTTINLSDNINMGYSHYYNEVRRVKYIAEKISELRDVVVIFDELFRGTNVKDAHEASLAVISAFADLPCGLFAISTHILEVAVQLKQNKRIDFRFFEIENRGDRFHYTYLLKSGISSERLGMYILNQEKVVETIRQTQV